MVGSFSGPRSHIEIMQLENCNFYPQWLFISKGYLLRLKNFKRNTSKRFKELLLGMSWLSIFHSIVEERKERFLKKVTPFFDTGNISFYFLFLFFFFIF